MSGAETGTNTGAASGGATGAASGGATAASGGATGATAAEDEVTMATGATYITGTTGITGPRQPTGPTGVETTKLDISDIINMNEFSGMSTGNNNVDAWGTTGGSALVRELLEKDVSNVVLPIATSISKPAPFVTETDDPVQHKAVGSKGVSTDFSVPEKQMDDASNMKVGQSEKTTRGR